MCPNRLSHGMGLCVFKAEAIGPTRGDKGPIVLPAGLWPSPRPHCELYYEGGSVGGVLCVHSTQ